MNLPPPESHLQILSKTRLADGSYKVLGIYKEEAGRRCILCREETHDFQGIMNHEGTWLSRYSLHRNQAQCLRTRERKLEARRGGKKPRPLKKLEQVGVWAGTRSRAEVVKPASPVTQSRAANKPQPKTQQIAQPRDKKPESPGRAGKSASVQNQGAKKPSKSAGQKKPGRKAPAEKPGPASKPSSQAGTKKQSPTRKPTSRKPTSRKPTSRKPTSRKPTGGKSPAAKAKAAKTGQAQSKKPGGQKTKRRGSPQTGQTSRRSEKQ